VQLTPCCIRGRNDPHLFEYFLKGRTSANNLFEVVLGAIFRLRIRSFVHMISRCVELPTSVVVEFYNHEILVKIGLPRAGSCFSAKKAELQRLLFHSGTRFYTACEASRFSSIGFTCRS